MTTSGAGARAADNAGRPDVADASVGELIGEVTRDLSTLMRQELDLAKAELKQEASKTGRAAGMLGAAGLAGYMVLLFLSIALWWALSNVMDQGWAALIVAAIWAVIGAVLYSTGRKQMRAVHPKPERTAETLKQVPDALKGR
jgi:putative superfamily III holin-X